MVGNNVGLTHTTTGSKSNFCGDNDNQESSNGGGGIAGNHCKDVLLKCIVIVRNNNDAVINLSSPKLWIYRAGEDKRIKHE